MTRVVVWVLLIGMLCAGVVFAQEPRRLLLVSVPVADIRRVPEEGKLGFEHDDLNETQVLYNEVLVYKGENAGWYQVEVEEQKEFTHQKNWEGYPGWIKKDKAERARKQPEYNIVVTSLAAWVLKDPSATSSVLMSVSLGTMFSEIGREGGFYKVQLLGNAVGWIAENDVMKMGATEGEDQRRQNIVKEAKLFLGAPYYWGGRAFGGVDCSGLVNLAYRASGVDVPRDSHEQWMAATSIVDEEMKPGDLIFVSKPGNIKSIVHVMLYLGGEDFIEAPGTGMVVLISDFKKKFGLSRDALKEKNYIVSGAKIYFGKILP